ncbi:MAG: hypothetical protein SynsKO_04860 [Synoicihabitans sp.]
MNCFDAPRLLRVSALLFISLACGLHAGAQTGVVVGLGHNRYGQLGSDVPTLERRPVQLVESGITQVVGAGRGSLLLRNDGVVLAAGLNSSNRLFDRDDDDWRFTSPVEAWTGIRQITASFNTVLVVTQDGRLLGRGSNGAGQIATTGAAQFPDQFEMFTEVTAASAGEVHSLWLGTDEVLRARGSNQSGQLGLGSSSPNGLNGITTVIDGNIRSFSAGGGQTLYTRLGNSLWGLGLNTSGQLGLGHTNNVFERTMIANDVTDVQTTTEQTVFRKVDESLWGMGRNNFGELGPLADSTQTTPVQITTGVKSFATQANFTVYVDNAFRAWGLGANGSGQLGQGDTTDRAQPVWIMDGVADVSVGTDHTLLLKVDGSVWGMGNTDVGQLFRAPEVNNSAGQRSLAGIKKISAGWNTSYLLRHDGTLYAIGHNGNANLLGFGIGIEREGFHVVASNVTDVSTTGLHTLFTKADGSLWFTGSADYGTAGTIPAPPSGQPAQIATNVVAVATSYFNSYFIDGNSVLWGSGRNTNGQLGLGHKGTVWAREALRNDVSAVEAGQSHTVFQSTDGGLWGMGANGSGVLGSGTGSEALNPVFITHGVRAFDCGWDNTYFVNDNGQLMGLGRNNEGQLGENPEGFFFNTPTLIANDATAVYAGFHHVTWTDSAGNLWGVGRASSGQLGEPIVDFVRTPRLIARQVISATAHEQHTLYTQVPETFLTNLSTRVNLKAENSGNLVAGFVVSGTEPMDVLVRAVGPSLARFDVAEPLQNPSFKIYNSAAEVIGGNDDWASDSPAELSSIAQELGAFALDDSSTDAAALVTLNPGAYTIHVERPEDTGGTVLLEVYKRNASQWRSRLVNLSVRNQTGRGDDTMIAGFVATGPQNAKLLVRAVGPTLADYGVPNTMDDPNLRVFTGSTLVTENDDWGGDDIIASTASEIGGFALPTTSKDSATVTRLTPGAYTAQVTGSSADDIGEALVEVYTVDE